MENLTPPQDQTQFASPFGKPNLPNATTALVCGIVSIPVGCCLYGIPGLVLGIIAILKGNKMIRLFEQNPNIYTESSYKNAKAGRICGIVGLCIAGLSLIISVLFLALGMSGFLEDLVKNSGYN